MKGTSKGLDQGTDRSTELCVFPPSKFIKWQIVFHSFSLEKIRNSLFYRKILQIQKKLSRIDVCHAILLSGKFKIPTIYI